jgi:hypothetical protein
MTSPLTQLVIDMLAGRLPAGTAHQIAAHYRTDPKHTAGMIRLNGGQG